MEDIMDHGQNIWDLDTISNRTTPFQNFVRPNIMRSYFCMDSKPMHTSHRRYLEIHMVTNFKLQGSSSLVCISFLMVPSCFQMTLNNTDLLSRLFNKIRPKVTTAPTSTQLRGVQHFLPYGAPKGAIRMLS